MRTLITIVALTVLGISADAHADPSGFLPRAGSRALMKRVEPRQTYVFFDRGVQTFVIQPELEGRADLVGMLVAVPSRPTVEVLDGPFFEQLASVMSPAPLQVLVTDTQSRRADSISRPDPPPPVPEVQVVDVRPSKVEVIDATTVMGVRQAVERLGLSLPPPMNGAVGDYASRGWSFVAIVVEAGVPEKQSRSAYLPRPPKVRTRVSPVVLRFRCDAPVLPLRLSAHDAHGSVNRVFVVAADPMGPEAIEPHWVGQQLSGGELLAHLQNPLPIVVHGTGSSTSLAGLNPEWRGKVEAARDPLAHVQGAAGVLLADVAAAQNGTLSPAAPSPLNALRRYALTVVEADIPWLVMQEDDIDLVPWRQVQAADGELTHQALSPSVRAWMEPFRR